MFMFSGTGWTATPYWLSIVVVGHVSSGERAPRKSRSCSESGGQREAGLEM